MTDATDRARAALYEDLSSSEANLAVDALMSDPDLLVDLALEAGGLEPVGYVNVKAKFLSAYNAPEMRELGDEPVYRRKEKP